jgi:23S rRNA (uracil1939-C5)-methyltransferase
MYELSFEKWVYGGDALGRWEGQVVLAPYLVPGETARVEVERKEKGLLRARPIEILTPAPQRVPPPCPYFGRCGGCHYQHTSYPYQLEQKQAILREVLRRVGKLEPPSEIDVIAGEPWGYRNRVQLHAHGGQVGYLEAGSHTLCAIDACPIASPRINQVLREGLDGYGLPRQVESVELFTNEQEVQASTGVLDYRVGAERYRISRYSFFQVNRFLLDAMVARVVGERSGAEALDLYAGVGLFSIPLARRFTSVTAVESGGAAYRDLQFNAGRAGVAVRAERMASEQFLESVQRTPDFVLADPPRAGLGKNVVRHLLRLRAPRLTIVSCDPATLARDLAPLTAAGYRMERMTLVDLFPQTYHIETVVDLALPSGEK